MKQLLLILLGVISLPSWAQSQLKGVIKDTQANPIGWATVILQATDNPKE
ncbi:hypothetical protein HMPREF9714_01723 [Myroides odoratimimus CCUG 12901]|nr:hypothetical protein [Myroides odoratimimus]EHO10038.1 hypothetical protein HMPREF9714_01723 [Myroides odoratimimus CCUG 12901]